MSAQQEKRAHPRFELLAQVQVTRQSEVHIMSAVNISRGGIFIRGEPGEYPDLRVGTTVEVVIFDPDNPGAEDVSLAATVVRIEGGAPGGRTGFGLQFKQLGIFESAGLDQLLQRLSEPPPPPPKT